MISMSKVNSIRQLRREGHNITEISKMVGVARDTVYNYLQKEDFSPKICPRSQKPSILDPFKPLIDSWLKEDMTSWRKQRHTARRIWERLKEEHGFKGSETTVSRYVKKAKTRLRVESDMYLDLEWSPGEAQADFGEADFYLWGSRVRLKYFVVSFPYSNVGLAQVFPGETAECVCEGLKRIFEYVGGVPARIVFDNATGIGRKVCKEIRTTELFGRFAAHYDFSFSFCNPNSGNEKGNVENKVGYIRRKLFVPVKYIYNFDMFNRKLLDKCMALSDKAHWIKGETESQLFVEDAFAMQGLPAHPFDCVTILMRSANKQGKIRIGGVHLYSTDPAFAGCELTVALGAFTVKIYDSSGNFICEHERAYGSAPTDTTDPASQLPVLCNKAGAWQNSKVRSAMSDGLREYMDSLCDEDLRSNLRTLRDECKSYGWDATIKAAEMAYLTTGRMDSASVSAGAARMLSGIEGIAYDEPVDLSVYDVALGSGR